MPPSARFLLTPRPHILTAALVPEHYHVEELDAALGLGRDVIDLVSIAIPDNYRLPSHMIERFCNVIINYMPLISGVYPNVNRLREELEQVFAECGDNVDIQTVPHRSTVTEQFANEFERTSDIEFRINILSEEAVIKCEFSDERTTDEMHLDLIPFLAKFGYIH
jgi:hypothetical protein